jgi:UDP-N-acetylmuramate--alanine ligase
MRYHFIGIGGIGMSAIAHLLLAQGENVSGSDELDSSIIFGLRAEGARVDIGHSAANVKDVDAVVYSSAIRRDNPELQAAREKGLPLLKRAQALAQMMEGKETITVTGSHGKTTTTALVSHLLLRAGLRPTVVAGGIVRNIGTNARFGDGIFLVAEADESDGSFLYYHPRFSLVTNVDNEHLDYYKDFPNLVRAYSQFIYQTRQDGCLIACYDDPVLREILSGYPYPYLSYGLQEGAQISARGVRFTGLRASFEGIFNGASIGEFEVALGGEHNVVNSLAVIALAIKLNIDLAVVKEALVSFQGAARRLEVKFERGGLIVIDDYGHHPTEIRATLAAAKRLPHQRLIVIFQPHRYSRTRLLFNQFAQSFAEVDQLMITDIYAASEPAEEGVTAESLVTAVRAQQTRTKVKYLPKTEIVSEVLKIAQPGDIIVTLGAGDITKISDELARCLKDHSKA